MKYKPYRNNQVLAKLQAARTRLGRLYVSEVSEGVKECLQRAAIELGRAERLLNQTLLGFPIKLSENVPIGKAVVLGDLGEVFWLPLTEQEDVEVPNEDS